MADLKSSMQFDSDTFDEKLLEVDAKVSKVYLVSDENIKTLIDDRKNMQVKFKNLEDGSRRNNLLLDGLLQTQGDEWHESEAKIKKFIKKKKRIENVKDSACI